MNANSTTDPCRTTCARCGTPMILSYAYAAECEREGEKPMCKLCDPWPPLDRANVLTPRQRAKLYRTT